ncbi:hypothetical protein KV697_09410 [Sphingomonas sanguinis]|uniref:hypothetical protein n=1 Tax=Sphingomonas sanguinis TaxID=33051 RepID=UPI001C59E9DA|nr:hypothetical protein [Sphingomonas sanguinis]QXT37459.1 hypothetical protein KV697_09410 [Sphingomonas sanguinis]
MANDDLPPEHHRVVPMPGSLTDVAHAVRTLFDLFGLGEKTYAAWVDFFDRRQARIAARGMARFRFGPGGAKAILAKLAEEPVEAAELARLAAWHRETQDEIDQALRTLIRYEDQLRENHGIKLSDRFAELLHGPVSKGAIRLTISDICALPYASAEERAEVSRKARHLLMMIDDLNTGFAELHEEILPPRKGPAARRKPVPRRAPRKA